ncbi:hypothetical protein EV421DRAFT_1918147 [Armillaria borealis]|uniref:Uncharacterized protein n=1 Tax=Armillaria borealis TaxID=47425 RepID=A0AA39HYH3_9AGAR|nr:hypothetical protein EV421DRAFT_1918147 [Armillaria borealis]
MDKGLVVAATYLPLPPLKMPGNNAVRNLAASMHSSYPYLILEEIIPGGRIFAQMFCFTRLPQELIDSILDFLIDDSHSLKASSLRFQQFRNMCQASPHIPPRVETLALHSGWDDRKIRGTTYFGDVMSLFSHLRAIKFIYINWTLLSQDIRAALSSHAFQCISFHCVTGINTSELFFLVSRSHASLHTLELHHTDVAESQEQSEQSAPHVTNLTVYNSALSPELFWNDTSFLSPRHDHTLNVLLHNMSDIRRLQGLLSEGLCPLQNLIVSHMPCHTNFLDQLKSSDHLRLSGLRTITVHMWDNHSDDQHLLQWWIGNLRQCDEIQHITFCITLGVNIGDCAMWKGLDSLLSEHRFPALTVLVIEVNAILYPPQQHLSTEYMLNQYKVPIYHITLRIHFISPTAPPVSNIRLRDFIFRAPEHSIALVRYIYTHKVSPIVGSLLGVAIVGITEEDLRQPKVNWDPTVLLMMQTKTERELDDVGVGIIAFCKTASRLAMPCKDIWDTLNLA